ISRIDWTRFLLERISLSASDSGGQHFDLIALGFDALNQDWTRWLVGVGFGMSPDYLGEFFGNKVTGNFHSFYLTLLVETGVLGLVCAIGATVFPSLRRGRRLLAAAVLLFSVLYQAHLDGAFWLAIMIVWLLPDETESPEMPRPLNSESGSVDQASVQEEAERADHI